jgi:hypothetical protein
MTLYGFSIFSWGGAKYIYDPVEVDTWATDGRFRRLD